MINPIQCELQVRGAALMGLGQSLFEELLSDDTGTVLNANLADYLIPSFLDVPRGLDETILETPGTIEAHGIGETGLPAVPPAIANAVARATGARIRDLPITPEKILRAGGRDQPSAGESG
jgi:CO/xanthine dehydrogenase Mo-binding subunit